MKPKLKHRKCLLLESSYFITMTLYNERVRDIWLYRVSQNMIIFKSAILSSII